MQGVKSHSDNSFVVLNNSVINANERNDAHVPQEVLFSKHLIEGDEAPSLYQHREK